FFFFSSRRRHTIFSRDWSSDVCSSDLGGNLELVAALAVNTPGFPLLASGATDDEDAPLALVASLGPCPGDAPKFARGGRVSEADQVSLARHIVSEWRAAERREADAKALIAGEVRRQASALIEKVD